MNIEKALAKYGLDEKEISLYLCLLKNRELSVLQLSNKTSLPRTTVYHTLDTMKKKGIVNSQTKNGVVRYTSENPKFLIHLLKEKERMIQDILPSMMSLMDSVGKNPTAKLYIGEEGVKHVFEDLLETINNEDVPLIQAVSQLDILEAFPRFFPDWQKRRHANTRTFTQLIVPETARATLPELFKSRENRETRFFPKQFPFQSSIEIYGSKTATISLQDGEYHSIIIDSPTVTNTIKQFFLFTWGMIEDKDIK